LIAILVFALASIGLGIYFYSAQNQEVVYNPVDAIPESAAIVVCYSDITRSWARFEQMDYFDAMNSINEFRSFLSRYSLIDSLLIHDKDIQRLFQGSVIWSSYHPKGGDTLEIFHAIKPAVDRTKKINGVLERILNSNGATTVEQLGSNQLFKVVFENPYQVLYYGQMNGLVLLSSDDALIRTSISQMSRGASLKDDLMFQKASESAGKNVDADIYVNYRHLPKYLELYLKPGVNASPGMLGSMASWTELDLNLKEDGISFNGFSYTNDTVAQYLNVFLHQEPQAIEFPGILPANTASYVFFGINDVISMTSEYRKVLDRFGKLQRTDAKLDSLNDHYGIDIENSLLAWMGNEFGVCVTEPSSISFSENSYAVVKARSVELAEKLLSDMVSAIDNKKGLESESVQVDDVSLRKLNFADILPDILGPSFEHFDDPYYMITNNHVIFGKSVDALKSYLHYINTDKTLGRSLAFSNFINNLGSSYNVFTYHQIARSKFILESYLNHITSESFNANEKYLNHFEAIGSQITSTGESFYSNIFVKYNPNGDEEKQSSWEAKMDAEAQIPPVFVKNHLTQETEILVQDKNNTLYLFNQFGQEVFKVVLPEAILSQPKQVDAFKNEKLQYIFNTKNFIYLLDRNGRNVGNYPIELDSQAETELTVVEYDRKRDYRLLITCKNKRIYNFDIKGKKVSGWKHNKAAVPTIHQFKHLFTGGKDFLVTGEAQGKIHLLDRRGKNRTKVNKRVVGSKNNSLQTFGSRHQAFRGVYLTDHDGSIYRVSLDGKVNEMNLGKFSSEHYFLVSDLDNDDRPEFIFADLNMLKVYNYKKELVFEQRLDPTATEPFVVLGPEGNREIGICYRDPEQLILYNNAGELHKGFPLSGSSRFDLMLQQDGRPLVVSSGSGPALLIQSVQ